MNCGLYSAEGTIFIRSDKALRYEQSSKAEMWNPKDKSKDRDIENVTPAKVTEYGHIENLLDQNYGKSRRKRKSS